MAIDAALPTLSSSVQPKPAGSQALQPKPAEEQGEAAQTQNAIEPTEKGDSAFDNSLSGVTRKAAVSWST